MCLLFDAFHNPIPTRPLYTPYPQSHDTSQASPVPSPYSLLSRNFTQHALFTITPCASLPSLTRAANHSPAQLINPLYFVSKPPHRARPCTQSRETHRALRCGKPVRRTAPCTCRTPYETFPTAAKTSSQFQTLVANVRPLYRVFRRASSNGILLTLNGMAQ
jgi:hypothetical protein